MAQGRAFVRFLRKVGPEVFHQGIVARCSWAKFSEPCRFYDLFCLEVWSFLFNACLMFLLHVRLIWTYIFEPILATFDEYV